MHRDSGRGTINTVIQNTKVCMAAKLESLRAQEASLVQVEPLDMCRRGYRLSFDDAGPPTLRVLTTIDCRDVTGKEEKEEQKEGGEKDK